MIATPNCLRLLGLITCIGLAPVARGDSLSPSTTNHVAPIDLPTVLRLAGARNLDVQIAQQRLSEARANRRSAKEQFLPWISPGVTYHRRDGMAQAVPAGTVSETHFDSYAPGATFSAQLNLGEAIYQSLAAQQLVEASNHGLESQRLESTFNSAQSYLELLKARSVAEVLKDAISISRNYEAQLHDAIGAGIAFKGDELRVRTQTQNYEIGLSQAMEKQRAESANLAQILHLNPAVELVPQQHDLVPITLFATNSALDPLIQQALEHRPELKQTRARLAAARETRKGSLYGPLIPSLGAQVFAGGLGGGHDDAPSNFGDSQDYQVTLGWRIGPGGLLDFGKLDAGKARVATVQLEERKLEDAIVAEVVTVHNRIESLAAQIGFAQAKMATATETLQLTRDRKQFGVGIVLEDIQAQQELARARSDYINAVAEFNKAQFTLGRIVGATSETLLIR